MKLSDMEYADVINLLNEKDKNLKRTKPHRLPHERYTWSDSDYVLTLCARHLGEPFGDLSIAQSVQQALMWYRAKYKLHLFCYCLMPDQLHFIVKLPDTFARYRSGGVRKTTQESILDIVGDFKSYTTSQIWWNSGKRGKLWQKSSYDNIIRYNDSVEAVVHYVLNNPVRKNLVEEWHNISFFCNY